MILLSPSALRCAQVCKCTGVFLRKRAHVCIVPCTRRNGLEWRRDADRGRGGTGRCEAQINRRLRTCIRLEGRIRILDADFVQFASAAQGQGKRRGEGAQCTAIGVKMRRAIIYTYEKTLQKTCRLPIKTERLPSR